MKKRSFSLAKAIISATCLALYVRVVSITGGGGRGRFNLLERKSFLTQDVLAIVHLLNSPCYKSIVEVETKFNDFKLVFLMAPNPPSTFTMFRYPLDLAIDENIIDL